MTNLDELEDLLRKGEKEKAYELVKEDKGITAGTLINEGITFGTIREYDLSISYFELAEKISEDDKIKEAAREQLAVIYYNRGLAYARSNQYEEAINDFNKALELDPKYAGAYNNRGNVYHELKQYKKAIEDYNKALELNPNLTVTYSNRGITYCKLNKTEEAIEDYNAAIKLNSKYAKAYYDRGNAYYELNNYKKAIKDFKKALELNPKDAGAYANRGITRLQTNEDLDKAIEDFKHARIFFEEKDKERMLGFIEWAKARKAMNLKNWDAFRERMNEAREIFEKINDPLSHSLDALIKFSFTDQDLDDALEIPDPIEASEKIERTLKNLPKAEGLIEPERTIFSARISSFAILSGFISSMRSIDENTDLEEVKIGLTKLHKRSEEVEKMFEFVNFETGKTTIVDMQRIISSVKQEIEEIKWAANKKQKALETLKKYWSRLSSAIKMMNGISTSETENIALRREIGQMKGELRVRFLEMRGELAGAKEIISAGFEKIGAEHEEILKIIYETKNTLLQKDVVNVRYRIEIKAPLISSLSPISPKIIVDIPMGNLTEEQIEEKAEEIADKIKDLSGMVKKEFLEAIKRVPETGKKLWKRLKKTKG